LLRRPRLFEQQQAGPASFRATFRPDIASLPEGTDAFGAVHEYESVDAALTVQPADRRSAE
jgi:hypothetical protein